MSAPPKTLQELIARFDPEALDVPGGTGRVRLACGDEAWDAVLDGEGARLEPAVGRPDALLQADTSTWRNIAKDVRGGMDAHRARRLTVRHNLHLGVGFLAATSGLTGPGRLTFRQVQTSVGELSLIEAGTGPAVVMLHGLGGTKASFLPTVSGLADRHRTIAVDLPGFGDSVKPLAAPYDAPYFARATLALMDELGLERAHLVGNSMGGRVALEVALAAPERVRRLVLLAPSLAWLRRRRFASWLRWVRPELGLIQPMPRALAERVVTALIPGARSGWVAAGVDEFLRAFVTARGRAAFYAAARNIYLEEPDGRSGFWPRLPELEPESLFVWGERDPIVPIAFAAHVERALPRASHVRLDCGHVPQVERPRETNAAIARFLGARAARRRAA